jgi:hypothetical protein
MHSYDIVTPVYAQVQLQYVQSYNIVTPAYALLYLV